MPPATSRSETMAHESGVGEPSIRHPVSTDSLEILVQRAQQIAKKHADDPYTMAQQIIELKQDNFKGTITRDKG